MSFCGKCGKDIGHVAYCPFCGTANAIPDPDDHEPRDIGKTDRGSNRTPRKAIIIALFLGLVGLMGMGHLYIGRKKEGVIIMLSSFVLIGAFLVSLLMYTYMLTFLLMIVIGSIWIWQMADLRTKKEPMKPEAMRPTMEPHIIEEEAIPNVPKTSARKIPVRHSTDELRIDVRMDVALDNPIEPSTAPALLLSYIGFIVTLAFVVTESATDFYSTWSLLTFLLIFLLVLYSNVIIRPETLVIKRDGVLFKFRLTQERFIPWNDIEMVVSQRTKILKSSPDSQEGFVKPMKGTPIKVRSDLVREMNAACLMCTGKWLNDIVLDRFGRIRYENTVRPVPNTLTPDANNAGQTPTGFESYPAALTGFERMRPLFKELKPINGVILAMVLMGMGHLYAQSMKKGMALSFTLMGFLTTLIFMHRLYPLPSFIILMLLLMIWIIQVFDAGKEVSRYNERLRDMYDKKPESDPVPLGWHAVPDHSMLMRPVTTREQEEVGMREALSHEAHPIAIHRRTILFDISIIATFLLMGVFFSFLPKGTITFIMAALMAVLMGSVLFYRDVYNRPISATIGRNGVLLRFRKKADRFLVWDDIVCTRSTNESKIFPSTQSDGCLSSWDNEWYGMNPEVVKEIEEGYRQSKGRYPLSFAEYRNLLTRLSR